MSGINITTNLGKPHFRSSEKQTKPNYTTVSLKPEQQDSFTKKKQLTENQKIGIGIAITTIALVLVNALINKYRRMQAIKQIPEELKTIFNELKGEQGENFINKAYSKLKTYMKLDDIAPDKISKVGVDNGTHIQGGFIPTLNIIEYTDGFFTRMPKSEQFAMLAHELKHAEQASKILRSGFLDKYADTWTRSALKRNINNPIDINFNMAYDNAVKNGEKETFIKNIKENIKGLMTQHHSKTLKMPQYKPGSPEYIDAEKYLEATRKYSGIEDIEEYMNNPLEKEAYAWGDKLGKYFRDFFR